MNRKTGKIRPGANEVVVGNRYFIKREFEHMTLHDLNFVFQVRISRRTVSGAWLENMWSRSRDGDEAAQRTLRTYAATLWSILTVAPDNEFITESLGAVKGALDRHKDWYGLDDSSNADGEDDEGKD